MGLGAGLDGTENLAATGIRSPDLPAHSESLYRLSYPGRLTYNVDRLKSSVKNTNYSYKLLFPLSVLHNYTLIHYLEPSGNYRGADKSLARPTATSHIDTGFSWFPCVYKRMLRRFPSFQVATTCLSCSPPDLNFLVTYLMFVYM